MRPAKTIAESEDDDAFWDSPPSRRRAAKTNLVLGYAAIGLSVLTGIVLVPLYLRHIPQRLYGLWLATGGILTWLGVFELGVSGVMGQRIAAAYGRRNRRAVALYYANGSLLQILLSCSLVMVAALVFRRVPGLLGATLDEARILYPCNVLAAVGMGFTLVSYGQRNLADALLRPLVPSLAIAAGGVATAATTVLLIVRGVGLPALAIGAVVGSGLTLAVCFVNAALLVLRAGGPLRYDREASRDILRQSGPILLGKAGNALVGRIEPALVAWLIRPEDALVFSLTRRAADLVQQILDRFIGSLSAGFAHYCAERQPDEAARLVARILSLTFGTGLITLCTYIALNGSFVSLWVGAPLFGGTQLTVLVAVSVATLSLGNLLGGLLSSTGDFASPAVALAVESCVRLVLMVALLRLAGMGGLPVAVAITNALLIVWLSKRLSVRIKARVSTLPVSWPIAIAAPALFVGSIVITATPAPSGWVGWLIRFFVVAGCCTAVVVSFIEPVRREVCDLLARGRALIGGSTLLRKRR